MTPWRIPWTPPGGALLPTQGSKPPQGNPWRFGTGGERWGPTRQRAASLSALAAFLTAGFLAALGETGAMILGAGAYLGLVILSLFMPAAITAQVLWGVALVARLIVGPDGIGPFPVLPAVMGIILTAELLSVVARLDTPFEGHPRRDLPRAVWSSILGGTTYATVAWMGSLPGPGGFGGVILASGLCASVAILLARIQAGPGSDTRAGD